MNYKIIRYFIGKMLMITSVLLVIPLLISLYYRENILLSYIIPIIASATLGGLCSIKKPQNNSVHIKDGFVICSLTWIIMSFFGALPFYISGEIPSFTDAYFETVSGFTTTGATILSEIEAMSKSLLFWRSFTHWVGGMGVLVLALAIFDQKDTKTMFIMRAEVPGPKVGKLVSKTRFTARILYLIYIGLTIIQVLFLLAGDMPLIDSVITAMATAGTGGFCAKNASIAGYNSAYIEYVVSIFMLLFGINFTIYYLLLLRRVGDVIKNEEIRTYIIIVILSTLLIWLNISPLYDTLEQSFRTSFFQVSSIITTTGFSTADYNLWPAFSQIIIILLMMMGGCAGSTAGGLKIIRAIVLSKITFREIRHAINPRAVVSVNLDHKPAEQEMVSGITSYFAAYMTIMAISIIFISLDNLTIIESSSAVITCFNNVGPGLGVIGPAGNFSTLSDFSKWILIFDMLAGRLEMYPILALFLPSFWK